MLRKATIAAVMTATLSTAAGCGGDDKHAVTPPAPSASAAAVVPSATPSATAAPAASASATPAASAKPEPPPPPKATFSSAVKGAGSGKVDKVGKSDGAFKPDGVKDLVIEVEYEGGAAAFLVLATDAQGTPNGEFSADTFVGTQALPPEAGVNLNQGRFTGGVAVFEGDKLLNGKDGGLTPLAEGKHKLALHVSSKDAPQGGSYKVVALLADSKTTVSSPVVVMGEAKKPESKPTPKGAGAARPKGTGG